MGLFDSIGNFIGSVVDGTGIITKDYNANGHYLGEAMRKSDKKPEDFDSINDYIAYLREEIKSGNIALDEYKTDLQKGIDAALGTELNIKAIDEKYNLQTSAEFFKFDTNEIQFHYFIGCDDGEGKFEMIIDKNKVSIENRNPMEFLPYADRTKFEIYYTKDVRATTNELPLEETTCKRLRLDKKYGKEDRICIWATGLDTIQYGVYNSDGELIKEFDEVQLITK